MFFHMSNVDKRGKSESMGITAYTVRMGGGGGWGWGGDQFWH